MGYIASEPLMNAVYAAADVFVNTSLGDTFSLTTLESLAAGTPVVAYASGGIPEIVVDGETGALVPPDDGGLLASTLRQLITSGKAATWRAASRSRAETFGHRRVVSDYLNVYEQAIRRFRS
jgi:glycosyltransferase involved in cell wall biosynthesis